LQKAILNTMSERHEAAEMCLDADGNPEPDTELRDYENVPLKEDIHGYFEREVKPHVPDSWIDESKTRVGYEIPFNRHFYKYTPPRPLEEIKAEIKTIEKDILKLLAEYRDGSLLWWAIQSGNRNVYRYWRPIPRLSDPTRASDALTGKRQCDRRPSEPSRKQ
jgi:hypothetical protein